MSARRIESETAIERRTMAPWVKWGAILGCITAAGAVADGAWMLSNAVVGQLPVIKNHDQRLSGLEQSAITNAIIMQYRFDRSDEQLQMIKNILLQRQQTALNSTNQIPQ